MRITTRHQCIGACASPSGPGLRLVFTEHGRLSDAAPSAKRRVANRVLGLLPHEVFAVSEDLRQHILAEGFSPDAVGVIYNGIDVGPRPVPEARGEVRRSLGLGDRSFVVGTIARLDPVKDLGTLIRGIARLRTGRDVHLLGRRRWHRTSAARSPRRRNRPRSARALSRPPRGRPPPAGRV